MVMIVKGRAEMRFDQRWSDYAHVLEEGTPQTVGTPEPGPPDHREAVIAALRSGPSQDIQAAGSVLDRAWKEDTQRWPRRLAAFLKSLSLVGSNAFTALVEDGCQPDALAFRFHTATLEDEDDEDRDRLRRDLDVLDRLAAQARDAVAKYASRRKKFDDAFELRRRRAREGESWGEELQILSMDVEDFVIRDLADNQGLRRHLDGRKEPLTGNAEIQLMLHVRVVTGAFHDRKVASVLSDLRESRGLPGVAEEALKKKRKRWKEKLGRPRQQNK